MELWVIAGSYKFFSSIHGGMISPVQRLNALTFQQ